MSDKLLEAAREVVKRWHAWADGSGWDNPEYDDFSAALQVLANAADRPCQHDWQSFAGAHIDGEAIACAKCGKLKGWESP